MKRRTIERRHTEIRRWVLSRVEAVAGLTFQSEMKRKTSFPFAFLSILRNFAAKKCYNKMRTIFYPTSHEVVEGHYATTIGFFDGVHRGHRFLIGQLKEKAREKGFGTMVITFERHPRQVLQSDWQPQLLTSLTERIEQLGSTGIDQLVVLRFDKTMAALTAHQFMQQVLFQDLHARMLLTGYDNRFGHDRSESFSDYVCYGKEIGIEVLDCTPYDVGECRVSSSLIRRLLTEGDVRQAAICLDRPYTLTGTVVHGKQIGRTLGYPTANILLEDVHRQVPANGVYAVLVKIDDEDRLYRGMMNIGTRPTFEGHRQTLEANIFDFNEDIYGRKITVTFLDHLREERHFDSPDELKKQMEYDEQAARTLSYK